MYNNIRIRDKRYNCICVYIAIFFTLLGVLLTYKVNKNLVENEYEGNKFSLQGRIYAISEKANSYAITITDISHVKISTDTINIYNEDHKKINKILVYVNKECMSSFFIGDHVFVHGLLSAFEKPTNPGQFNEYNYYVKQQGYSYKTYIKSTENIRELEDNNSLYYGLKKKLYSIRQVLTKKYYQILDEDKAAIVVGMMLGDRSLITEDTKDIYEKMGISHILSISGLHISFIGMILYKLLSKLKIHVYITNILTIIFLYLYGIMTDFSVSTNRAVVMMAIMLIGKMVGRTYDIYTALSLSLILILFQNPLIIYNTGLQFSYASVIGIVVIYPFFNNIIQQWKESQGIDVILNKKSKKETFDDSNYIYNFRDGIIKLLISFRQQLIAGISIYIVNIPIMLNSYYEISVCSILVNILVIGLVELLMAMSIISVIISFLSIKIASVLGATISVILNAYEWIGQVVSNIIHSVVVIGNKDITEIVFYYSILVLTIYLAKKNKKYVFILLLSALIFFDVSKDELQITMLDVSQGDGICIETVNNKVIMMDGGSTDINDLEKYRIIPFLKSRGIAKIDYAMISHIDKDHISGIEGILKGKSKEIVIRNLVLPYIREENGKYEELIGLAQKAGCKVWKVKKGDKLIIDKVEFKCLHPTSDYKGKDANAYSGVFLMTYNKFDMLFSGDISSEEETKILKNTNVNILKNRRIEVLKVPHHGSKYSSHEAFIRCVNPKYAIISAGKDNMYGHPHKEVIKRYINNKTKVYTTIENGAISIKTNGASFQVN